MRHKHSIFLLLAVTIFLQGCGVASRIKKADKRFEIGEYYAAADMYRGIYSTLDTKNKPLKAAVAFRQAECYRLTNQTRAEQTYANAIRYFYPDSIVYLRYAEVLQRNGKYAEADKYYSLFLKKDSTNVEAQNGVLSHKLIPEWLKKPSRYVVKKADVFFYRRTASFSPSFMGTNYDVLVFTSTRPSTNKTVQKNSAITGLPTNDLFVSKKNAVGKWEKPETLEGEVNTVNDEGVCAFKSDGKAMFYSRSPLASDGDKGTEILSSNRAGASWGTPQKIKFFKDSTFSVAHPAISPDGETIYFVSDAKNGFGGKDIWKGKLESGVCKYIENLGPQINTSGDEMFPTVRADGTLYFSSNGHAGFGGLDIFKATQQKDSVWTVENMGAPVNASGDDFGMTFEGKTEKGFFSTNRGDVKGYDAIWNFELPEPAYLLEGKVTDEKGVAIPDATVRLVSNTGVNARVQTKKDGTYRIKLDKDMDCVMLATSRGYLNQKNNLTTQGLINSKTFSQNFKLSSISKPVELENIFYEFGKWDLTPASTNGLQVLVKMLTDNPNITIELSANTDYIGNNEANKILSQKRAKSVADYLIAAGIAADRLTTVGNGEEKPVVVDASLAKRYPYLKETEVLDEATILKLSTEQQEITKQINRRTEFRVLKTTYKLY